MKLPDKVYEVLKWIAIVCVPAVATAIKVIFPVWNIPYADQIVTTLLALATLLGALIGISSVAYHKNSNDSGGE